MIVTAIVPAAGAGIRFGGAVKKQFIALNGLPILSYTLRALAASNALSSIIVVVLPEKNQEVERRWSWPR